MRFAMFVLAVLLIEGCAERTQKRGKEQQNHPESAQSTIPTTPQPKGFEPVKVMLSQSCAPCHNPGGKMYERLPFDNPDVVRSHSDPILGRLNKPEEKLILEQWLSEPQL